MSEIEKAIEFTKKNIQLCERVESARSRLNIPNSELATDIHKTILQALEEKLEREQGHGFYNKSKKEEFEILTKAFINYLYKYATPHTTIIITQCGAEQLEGDMAVKFELRD